MSFEQQDRLNELIQPHRRAASRNLCLVRIDADCISITGPRTPVLLKIKGLIIKALGPPLIPTHRREKTDA